MRLLSLKGGGTISETLTGYSAKGKSLGYRIDENPLPVADYDCKSMIAVKPGKGGGSAVTWSSTFKAKGGATSADARNTIEGISDAGLDNLKTQLGG